MMKIGNGMVCEQKQILSQNQVQSLRILACSNQELNDLLTNEYIENPMLEQTAPQKDDFRTNIESVYERGCPGRGSFDLTGDEEEEQRKNDIPSRPADLLKKDLLMQLRRDRYSDGQWKLIQLLIDCLDESGFFPMEPGEVARFSGYPEQMVLRCLEDLKNLEPVGIFSKDLSECLLRQMEQQGMNDPALRAIVRGYLPDLLKGRIGNVTRALHLSTAQVRKYIVQIGKLNPRPVMNAQQQETEYIVPDILVEMKNGEWDIRLNDRWMGEYRVNDYYVRMIRASSDSDLTAYLKGHLERARFVIGCVEQRRRTVLKITREIVAQQEPFFRNRGRLRPMTLQDVAEKLEIHPSTVSRAVKGKYIQFQYGTVLVKDLFSACVPEQKNPEGVSAGQVRGLIRNLIAGEDKSKPLSDLALERELEKREIRISRRTVAKYRAELGIPNSDQRRYLPS